MKIVFSPLLPATGDYTIAGMKFPAYVFTFLAIISVARNCIHVFAPDAGAGSIAGMDLSGLGASGIVFAFALWGSAQFIYALILLAAAFRCRLLIAAMYVLLILETLLRMLVGHLKPVHFSHTPPAAIANYIILRLAILMLALSLYGH